MTLLLFTTNYPYRSYTEEAFVRPELEALAREYERVVVVPRHATDTLLSIGLPNVSVDLSLAQHRFSRWKVLKLPYLFCRSVASRLPGVMHEAHGLRAKLRGLFFVLNTVTFSRVISRIVARYSATDRVMLYSFWFDMIPDALVEAVAGRYPIVTRAHRFDVYDDQVTFRSRLMRRATLAGLSRVYVVSEHARRYMSECYPDNADKIVVSALGSRRSDDAVATASPEGMLTLLSVARVTGVKRVDRCADVAVALASTYPWLKVRWIHVGDGPEMASLRKRMSRPDRLPTNLTVDLRGALSNADVHDIYRSEPIDWFMLLSESEGLPVAICEAMSYGVPVLATAVGGIPEAVTPEVGIVLPVDATAADYVGEMQPYLTYRREYMALREDARRRWTEMFNAEECASRFAKQLKNLESEFYNDK